MSLDDCLAKADFFSLHMPLTPQTKVRAIDVFGSTSACTFALISSSLCDLSPYRLKLVNAMCILCISQNLFGDEVFGKIKKGARIVNVARGGVIDDAALARALDAGQVAAVRLLLYKSNASTAEQLRELTCLSSCACQFPIAGHHVCGHLASRKATKHPYSLAT